MRFGIAITSTDEKKHFDILIEDLSGKILIEAVLSKIINLENHTYIVHCYKGIGRLPARLNEDPNPSQRYLLTQLPKLLNGLGKTHEGYGEEYFACVIVICDLDKNDRLDFAAELQAVLAACHTKPETRFCMAIEECEAWLLGDLGALKAAYPTAKDVVLNSYVQDSICGTWELLADAIHPGGAAALKAKNYSEIGRQKCEWAANIGQHILPLNNISPSFQLLNKELSTLAE